MSPLNETHFKQQVMARERLRFTLMRKARRRGLKEFQEQQFQQTVVLVLLVMGVLHSPIQWQIWIKQCSTEWWDRMVITLFDEKDWLENFRMLKNIFVHMQSITDTY